jgi:hypothetical protein
MSGHGDWSLTDWLDWSNSLTEAAGLGAEPTGATAHDQPIDFSATASQSGESADDAGSDDAGGDDFVPDGA